MSYTPGPWYPGITQGGDIAIISKPIGNQVTIVRTITAGASEEEQRDNAALIAAAPDLLEALQNLLHSLPHPDSDSAVDPDIVSQAEAAIKKATTLP